MRRRSVAIQRAVRPAATATVVILAASLLILAGRGSPQGGGPSQQAPANASGARDAPAHRNAESLRLRYPGWDTDFSRHAVPLEQFQDGGPPRDGIPPIDHPTPVALAEGDRFLAAREPVIAVEVGGQARAYPIQILVWHEIVNDRLGSLPIAVTYCPLCNSAIVFDRRVGGRETTFGTTGKLRKSDLVMWDRATQSWWQQLTGEALVGALTGARLRPITAQTLSWADFKARCPEGTVLSRDTGFQRDYGTTPYAGYDKPDERPFLFGGRLDARLAPKERVIAVFSGGETAVVPFSRLARKPVVHARVGAAPIVVLFKRGVVSALDAYAIRDSRDVGTAGAFDARLRGRALRFAAAPGGRFTDRQSGSTWDITGRALAGPLRGARLRPLRHDEQFWFALAAFVPNARLLR
jgi:Protein of unknown function (DUF3179)